MKSLRFLDRRAGFSLASVGLLLGIVVPAALPAFASADVISSRSITMSSATKSADDTIEVKGTTSASGALPAGGGMVILFCNGASGPLIGTDCTAPTDMAITSPSATGSSTPGTATKIGDNAIKFVATGAIGNSTAFDFTVSGITNPSTVGTFYARIATYNDTNIATATDDKSTGVIDSGAVALSTTQTLGVTAYVLETMTFCTSHSVPTADCTGTDDPSMTIGHDVGNGQLALDSATPSTGTDYMQMSTNAVSGAVVNMKSDATGCGGLKLFGGNGCIPGQSDSGSTLTAGTAGFGFELGALASASDATNPSGTLQAAGGSHYNGSTYYLDSTDDDTAGVTTVYGSPFVDTDNKPVNNENLPFTFGAITANNTPAGKYTADFSMIATGTF